MDVVPMFGVQVRSRRDTFVFCAEFWNSLRVALHPTSLKFEGVEKTEYLPTHFEHNGAFVKGELFRGARFGQAMRPQTFEQPVVGRHVKFDRR